MSEQYLTNSVVIAREGGVDVFRQTPEGMSVSLNAYLIVPLERYDDPDVRELVERQKGLNIARLNVSERDAESDQGTQ